MGKRERDGDSGSSRGERRRGEGSSGGSSRRSRSRSRSKERRKKKHRSSRSRSRERGSGSSRHRKSHKRERERDRDGERDGRDRKSDADAAATAGGEGGKAGILKALAASISARVSGEEVAKMDEVLEAEEEGGKGDGAEDVGLDDEEKKRRRERLKAWQERQKEQQSAAPPVAAAAAATPSSSNISSGSISSSNSSNSSSLAATGGAAASAALAAKKAAGALAGSQPAATTSMTLKAPRKSRFGFAASAAVTSSSGGGGFAQTKTNVGASSGLGGGAAGGLGGVTRRSAGRWGAKQPQQSAVAAAWNLDDDDDEDDAPGPLGARGGAAAKAAGTAARLAKLTSIGTSHGLHGSGGDGGVEETKGGEPAPGGGQQDDNEADPLDAFMNDLQETGGLVKQESMSAAFGAGDGATPGGGGGGGGEGGGGGGGGAAGGGGDSDIDKLDLYGFSSNTITLEEIMATKGGHQGMSWESDVPVSDTEETSEMDFDDDEGEEGGGGARTPPPSSTPAAGGEDVGVKLEGGDTSSTTGNGAKEEKKKAKKKGEGERKPKSKKQIEADEERDHMLFMAGFRAKAEKEEEERKARIEQLRLEREAEEESLKKEEKLGRLWASGGDVMEEGERGEQEQNALQMLADATKKKELKPVDHSLIEYIPFRKNLYIVPRSLATMPPEELTAKREAMEIKIRGKGCPPPVERWDQCGLSDAVLASLNKHGLTSPFPIQKQAVPAIMNGRDVIGVAKTGSGKTLAFLLPMFRHILDQPSLGEGEGPVGLIMAPARELAVQIYSEAKKFSKTLGLRVTAVYGGAGVGEQIAEMKRGADIVVCTPGRMIDILTMQAGKLVSLSRVSFIVMDEADRMFDMGFEPQIRMIIKNIRPDRQTVLFSATFPRSVEQLARKILKAPLEIIVGGRSVASSDIAQYVEIRDEDDKYMRLLQLLGVWYERGNVLVFVDTQQKCDTLFEDLTKAGYPALSLHGGKDQSDRDYTISDFKGKLRTLMVATSVAGRGLDVPDLVCVINYSCPNHLEDYVHRVGRTGRAGRKGTAYTFISPEEEQHAPTIVKALETASQPVPPELLKMANAFTAKVGKGEARWASSGFSGKGFTFDENEKTEEQKIRDLERKQQMIEMGLTDDNDADKEKAEAEKEKGGGGGGGGAEGGGGAGGGGGGGKAPPPNSIEAKGAAVLRAAAERAAAVAVGAGVGGTGGADGGVAGGAAAAAAAAQGGAGGMTDPATAAAALEARAAQATNPQQAAQLKAQAALARMGLLPGMRGVGAAAPGVGAPGGGGGVGGGQTAQQQAQAKALEQMMLGLPGAAGAGGGNAPGAGHFSDELVINDYPQNARHKVTQKSTINQVVELTQVAIITRGVYVRPGSKPPAGERKLVLIIEHPIELNVKRAKTELQRILNEETLRAANSAQHGGSGYGKYSVV